MMTLNRIVIDRWMKFIFVVATVLMLGGCPWSGDDDDETERNISRAPQANFSMSVDKGTAPLSVSFVDTSDAGSHEITSRRWQFGDGAISDELAPTHVYQQPGEYEVRLTVTTVVGSDTYVLPIPVVVSPASAQLLLSVVDEYGVKLTDVTLSSSRFMLGDIEEVASGLSVAMTPQTKDGVIRIEKDGYLDGLVFLESFQGVVNKRVTLIKRAPAIKVDAFAGGRYSGLLGTSVDISAQSLVTADGTIVNGVVDLFITPLDTSNPALVDAFPGSYYGAMNDEAGIDDQGILLSYGVVDITFELNGEPLQLRDGAAATLTLPVFSDKDIDGSALANNMPVWTLNEQTGIWIYQNEGALIANQYMPNGIGVEVVTRHFTRFNCDINPPNLFRNANFSGSEAGSGGRAKPQLVDVIVEFVGGVTGRDYHYVNSISVFGSRSYRSRIFRYDGDNIRFRTIKGITLSATITDVEKPELSGFDSAITSSDPTILTIDLSEREPEFFSTSMVSQPIFHWGSNSVVEINNNKVFVGASFVGADAVTIESAILPTPLILSSGIYQEVEYEKSAGDPISFDMKLTNRYGETSATAQVAFIDSAVPDTGFTWLEETSAGGAALNLKWIEVDGAEQVALFHVRNGQQSYLTDELLSESLNKQHQIMVVGQFADEDYIRVVFTNQFGASEVFLPVNQTCPPNTDSCVPAQ